MAATPTEVPKFDRLMDTLSAHGQEHLLAFWNELSEKDRQRLASQIASIDFSLIGQLISQAASQHDWAALARRAEPPAAFRLDDKGNRFSIAEAKTVGETALRSGQVGAILVAGGQGSRLGFDHPKGMYKIGPVSGASLFQILFEKLLAVGRRYGMRIPLYLMTSPATDEETRHYLAQTNRFGLPAEDVKVFCQGTMPAVDAASGNVLLAAKDEVAVSPDGHGGMLAALNRSGNLANIEGRGIRYLFYFQVDNPMVVMCDPVLIGYHILSDSEMSTLVVAKRTPTDRVGNVVCVDGRSQIIEYSDFPVDVAEQRTAEGSLRFWAGSIAVHVFSAAYFRRAAGDATSLPFHVAHKKVPFVDERGKCLAPTSPNAIKFERFIFDLMPLAKNPIAVESDAAQTFAPVKNASDAADETRETCQAAMISKARKWLHSAGAKLSGEVQVEISPLFAVDAEEVAAKIRPGTVINEPTYLRP